jgi:putative transposase
VRRAAACKVVLDHAISRRRASRLVGVDPGTLRRDHPPDNPEAYDEMQPIARKWRRFGYRRIGVLLERKGIIWDHKKLYRRHAEEKQGVRRRRGRRRARGSQTPMPVALHPDERWSLNFVPDTFGAPRKFRMQPVNDDCCRETLCQMADTSISGARDGCAYAPLQKASLRCQR